MKRKGQAMRIKDEIFSNNIRRHFYVNFLPFIKCPKQKKNSKDDTKSDSMLSGTKRR